MQMNKMLMVACQNGQKGIVDVYLKKGCIDINGVDDGGFTALHYASNHNNSTIIELLLNAGAQE